MTSSIIASDFEKYRLTVRVDGDNTLQQGCDSTTGLTTWQTWRRGRSLGRGAFGEVHQQIRDDEHDDRHYRAVKVCREWSLQANTIDYKRELSTLAAFSNSEYSGFFVNLHGWWAESENIFIAMEYLSYGDLSRYVATGIPEAEIKEITENVLRGLQVMHKHGFTHRDIKPQNVLVVQKRPEFSRWWVKIADFGISKRVLEGSDTGLYTTIGTPDYVAPEVQQYVAQDEDTYTNKVDMWSLGCVLFNISSRGYRPFSGLDLMRYCEGLIAFNPRNLSICLNDDGLSFLKALLQVQPEQRPTATDALQHTWLKMAADTNTSNHNPTIIPDLHSTAPQNLPATPPLSDSEHTGLITRPEMSTPTRSTPSANESAQTTGIGATRKSKRSVSQTSQEAQPSSVRAAEENAIQGSVEPPHLTAVQDKIVPQQSKSDVNESVPIASLDIARKESQSRHAMLDKWFKTHELEIQTRSRQDSAFTPLHLAVSGGRLQIVKSMVEKGADIHAKDGSGLIPLHEAAYDGHLEVVKWLVEQGSDIHAKTAKHWTPSHYATYNGHLEVVKWLKEQGADVHAKASSGWTPSHAAARNGDLATVKWLKEQGADVGSKTISGWTFLHEAAYNGHLEVMKWLKDEGADIHAKTNSGQTPLHYAARNGHLTVVKWLKGRGANIHAKDSDGRTPYDLAKFEKQDAVVKWFKGERSGTTTKFRKMFGLQ